MAYSSMESVSWYEDFNQTSDAEVTDLLERAKW